MIANLATLALAVLGVWIIGIADLDKMVYVGAVIAFIGILGNVIHNAQIVDQLPRNRRSRYR